MTYDQKQIRVMITGAGSGVGQGILKCLRLSDLDLHIIAADINWLQPAFYRAEEAVLIPRVEQLVEPDEIISLLNLNRVDILLIGSEFEVLFFSQHRAQIEAKTNCCIVVSCSETIKLSNDKYLTAKFLTENNIAPSKFWAPKSLEEALTIYEEFGASLILKPRQGTSNRGVHVISKPEDLVKHFDTIKGPMLQELLAGPTPDLDMEYTCSFFRDAEGKFFGPFTARRTLKNGASWVVEVDEFEAPAEMLMQIAKHIDVVGSFNVQLMMTPRGAVPFEFNCRFSGTTAVRASFGFNEPEMAIRSFLLRQSLSLPKIRKGVAFRYLEEVFIEGAKATDLGAIFAGDGQIRRWF
tara:strand:+ start:969 stop:2024 length:1056 start_codon:yes stop_codon:yes gene_type:complete